MRSVVVVMVGMSGDTHLYSKLGDIILFFLFCFCFILRFIPDHLRCACHAFTSELILFLSIKWSGAVMRYLGCVRFI